MSLRLYLLIMSMATVAAWFGWVTVLMNQPPDAAVFLPFLLFYASLFVALIGTFALIGFLVRFHTHQEDLPFRQVALAFRQALSYAGLVIVVLILQSQRLLTLWNSFFLLGAFILLELFFLTRRRESVASDHHHDAE